MEDLGDVGDFPKPDPVLMLNQFLKNAAAYVKQNGKIAVMNLMLAEDPRAVQEMVEEGNIDSTEAELLSIVERLELFDIRQIDDDVELNQTPTDFPFYVAMNIDDIYYLFFLKDKRLAKLIDWSY
jgi:hypothetical protein